MDTRRVSAVRTAAVLNERHPEWRVAVRALIKAGRARPRRIPCAITNERCVFDPDEVETACAALICRYDRCDRVALGSSGGCSEHGHVFEGARAQGVKRPDIGPKISAKKIGSRHTLEARAKMARAKRKHPPVKRFDLLTGEQIIPKRLGLEHVPVERLIELELDLVPDHIVRRGHALFISQAHKARYQLEHDERFGSPGFGRRLEAECALCRGTITRYASQIAAAEREHRRFVCQSCDAIWRPALQRARRAVDELDPKQGLPMRSSPALARLFEVAGQFEADLRATFPPRRGQPRHFETDLIIEALHLRGFTDDNVDRILGGKSARYAQIRRQNAGIRRRTRDPKPLPRFAPRTT
ncbi:MAG: hypothetical protein ACYDA3_00750 [Gaiellaceae bacterium]